MRKKNIIMTKVSCPLSMSSGGLIQGFKTEKEREVED